MIVTINGLRYVPESRSRYQWNRTLTFGQMLAQRREDLGWSLSDASHNIGISRTYLWQLEQDKGDPSFRIVVGISTAYDMNLDQMASHFR